MKKFGIDISRWQGNFDIERAKREHDVEFVIIRGAGSDGGLWEDPSFEENYRKAKAAGVAVGCYFISKALTVDEARRDAEFFYKNCVLNHQFELPLYIDVEIKEQLALGKKAVTDIILAFTGYLEKHNCWAGIYASKSVFETQLEDNRLQYLAHWVAQCDVTECTYKPKTETIPPVLGMWQFGGGSASSNAVRSHIINGVPIDQNYLYFDYETRIKKLGANGYNCSDAEYEVYTVDPGDTLTAIAKKYNEKGFNTSIEKIAADNNIANIHWIYIGRDLKIYKG